MHFLNCARGAAWAALAFSVALVAGPAAAQSALTPKDAFEAGIEHAERGQHREAIAFFLIAYQGSPDSVGLLWNLGLSSAEIGEHREALKYWLAFQKLRPQEWRAQAKLIQTYQALGDIAARDRVRAELFARYQNPPPQSDLRRNEMYCREQMTIAGRKVLAFEHFEPQGGRRVLYTFVVVSQADAGEEDYRVSFGSVDAATQAARETGALPRDKRLYQLDKTQDKSRWNYGLYETQLGYEAVRAQVVEVVSGRARILSGSTPE